MMHEVRRWKIAQSFLFWLSEFFYILITITQSWNCTARIYRLFSKTNKNRTVLSTQKNSPLHTVVVKNNSWTIFLFFRMWTCGRAWFWASVLLERVPFSLPSAFLREIGWPGQEACEGHRSTPTTWTQRHDPQRGHRTWTEQVKICTDK